MSSQIVVRAPAYPSQTPEQSTLRVCKHLKGLGHKKNISSKAYKITCANVPMFQNDPTQNICNTSRADSDSMTLTVNTNSHYCDCILLQQMLMLQILYFTTRLRKINTFFVAKFIALFSQFTFCLYTVCIKQYILRTIIIRG